MERARSAHPELNVDDSSLRDALRAAVAGSDDPVATLDALRHGDLLLAQAATRGDPRAIALLERDHFGAATAAVTRMLGAAEGDDALQGLREKLLVPRDGVAGKLAEYGGRGSLGAWLKVVAVRHALSWLRARGADATPATEDEILDLPGSLEPEIEILRAHYTPAFKAAFQGALEELGARERTLLRLQFLEGRTVDAIGEIYGVHRATAARWVAGAREALLDRTRQKLAARLGLPVSQLDSIVDLVRSHVEVSLTRMLDGPADALEHAGAPGPSRDSPRRG